MTTRRQFLGSAVALAALLAGRKLPAVADTLDPPAAALPTELGVVRDSLLTTTNTFQVFGEGFVASGALCAPVEPFYALDTLRAAPPVAGLLGRVTAPRGGLSFAGVTDR